MAANGIYVVSEGSLSRLRQVPFDTEDDFQALLERYPDLLPGDQISPDQPVRWLLVCREAEISDRDEGLGRWSVDHLFVDQDGVPTFVEVKRRGDTRLRREVLGQILEYAANATSYWPQDLLAGAFAERVRASGGDPEEVLIEFLDGEQEPEAFWDRVWTNLRAGKVRLLIVADQITAELQRIVEFLNSQMSPAELLAVELQHFAGEGIRTLVPRVIGRTAQAESKKKPPPRSRPWNRDDFLDRLGSANPAHVAIAEQIFEWAESDPRFSVRFGRGATMPTFTLDVHAGKQRCPALYFFVNEVGLGGNLQFGYLKSFSSFEAVTNRQSLSGRFRSVYPDLDRSNLDGFPVLKFDRLSDPELMRGFQKTMDWTADQLSGAPDRWES